MKYPNNKNILLVSGGPAGEVKREAVHQVTQSGASAAKIARELEIHPNLLHGWVRELVPSKDARVVAKADAATSALAQESQRQQKPSTKSRETHRSLFTSTECYPFAVTGLSQLGLVSRP